MQEKISNRFSAHMHGDELENFLEESGELQGALIASLPCFEPLPQTCMNVQLGESPEFETQKSYMNIPFRDEAKGDYTSTVASNGGALLVADFIRWYFDCDNNIDIPQMAQLVKELGYLRYKKGSNGSWLNRGVKQIFFDRFVPNFYNLESVQMSDISDVCFAISEENLPILYVKDEVYLEDEESNESRFIAIVGFDVKENAYFLYDPEYSYIRKEPYTKVNRAIRNGWVFSKR